MGELGSSGRAAGLVGSSPATGVCGSEPSTSCVGSFGSEGFVKPRAARPWPHPRRPRGRRALELASPSAEMEREAGEAEGSVAIGAGLSGSGTELSMRGGAESTDVERNEPGANPGTEPGTEPMEAAREHPGTEEKRGLGVVEKLLALGPNEPPLGRAGRRMPSALEASAASCTETRGKGMSANGLSGVRAGATPGVRGCADPIRLAVAPHITPPPLLAAKPMPASASAEDVCGRTRGDAAIEEAGAALGRLAGESSPLVSSARGGASSKRIFCRCRSRSCSQSCGTSNMSSFASTDGPRRSAEGCCTCGGGGGGTPKPDKAGPCLPGGGGGA